MQESRMQVQLDQQLSYLPNEDRPPVGPIKDKRKFAGDLSRALVLPLRELLEPYKTKRVLTRLMENYDSLLHHAAITRLRLPSRLACFEGMEDTVESLLKEVNRSDGTSLATRCLIEFIAAEQRDGGDKEPSLQALDDAQAIMSLIILWGSTGDQVFYQLFDVKLSVLASQRIGNNTQELAANFYESYKRAKLANFMEQTDEDYSNYFMEEAPREGSPIPATLNSALKLRHAQHLTLKLEISHFVSNLLI